MTKTEWEKKAAELAAKHAARGEPSLLHLRQSLIEVDQLLRCAPTTIQQRYKEVSEAALRALTNEAQAMLDEGSLAWLDRDAVEAAAAQARALDVHFYQHRAVRGKPDDVTTDFLCTATQTHAIPRPLARPPEDPSKVTTTTYRRRGLIWHRLIPENTTDGYKVALEWHRDLSLSFRKADARVLAALFEDLKLVADQNFVNFVAKDAPCTNEDGAIQAQVAAAYGPDIVLALWPELTMPEVRRGKLAAALRAQSKVTPPGTGPAFVAAGSWHEVEGNTVNNRMHVLSRSGSPRFHYDKSIPLQSKTLGKEQLTPSNSVSVLIGEDALIAFAICRDFCEAQVSKVYLELDVDLVVVSSYGDEKTILAHRQQALNLSTEPGTRTFVVQQIVPEEVARSGTGYVLAPESDLAAINAPDMITNKVANSHPVSFKRV